MAVRPTGMRIRPDHPLNHLFAELVDRHLVKAAGVDDMPVARYVAGVLVDFTDTESLFRIRNASGKRLEEVGEMLIESHPLLGGRSFFYEREVRKHIGDYTMFLTGLFPEHVGRIHRRGSASLDAFVDFMKAGKESYAVVASFDQFEFRDVAPVFRRLSARFELCVFGLNMVKRELEHNQRAWYRSIQSSLGL